MNLKKYLVTGGDYRSFPLYSLDIEEYIEKLENKKMTEFEYMVKKQEELDKYRQGFNILMEYFDSISDEERYKVSKRLEKIGL